MSNELLHSQKIEEVINQLEAHYSLDNSEAYQIVIRCISDVYESDFPVLLGEDGVYAIYRDKLDDRSMKYVKIKYSKQKSKLILQKIKQSANDVFLKTQRTLVVDFLKTKKNYLHARLSHEVGNNYVYSLYFSKNFKHVIQRVKAIAPKTQGLKKRVYIDFTSAYYDKEFVVFKELRNFKTLKNAREFTKDIGYEIFEKISKKVWIEVKAINLNKNTAYLHLPYKTTADVIEYIQMRFKEVFELNVVFLAVKNKKV